MNTVTIFKQQTALVTLAREIAMDIQPLNDILKSLELTPDQFEQISEMPQFQELLKAELQSWGGALNTNERVKLKSSAMLEQFLPTLYGEMHREKNLDHVTKAAALVARLAGLGVTGTGVDGNVGERVHITINMGADAKLEFRKELPGKVIDATPTEVASDNDPV